MVANTAGGEIVKYINDNAEEHRKSNERWREAWGTVDQRCPEFDSMARISIAYIVYDHGVHFSISDVPWIEDRFPVLAQAICTYIQRSG
jgi:hypothetical protein